MLGKVWLKDRQHFHSLRHQWEATVGPGLCPAIAHMMINKTRRDPHLPFIRQLSFLRRRRTVWRPLHWQVCFTVRVFVVICITSPVFACVPVQRWTERWPRSVAKEFCLPQFMLPMPVLPSFPRRSKHWVCWPPAPGSAHQRSLPLLWKWEESLPDGVWATDLPPC